ncbi:unnamed protein product [Brassica napus]|uniref:(rape) hypothetical protein n=1 Tax=Brassica napus TaxID=3708 RepID=A0A816VUB2_BRANA|nr:unnamed protein product [Brassica napus]
MFKSCERGEPLKKFIEQKRIFKNLVICVNKRSGRFFQRMTEKHKTVQLNTKCCLNNFSTNKSPTILKIF